MIVAFVFLNTIIGSILTLQKLPLGNPNNFGPYEPIWTKYEMCRGPKIRNVTNTGLVLNKQNNDYIGIMDFNFTTQASVDEVKIVVYAVKDNKRNLMWAYKLVDPCKHFLIAKFIENELNAHNCLVEKAAYHRTVNFSDITKKLIGPSFFYGNYSLKALMLSKNGNILCLLLYIQLVKKIV